MLSIGGVRELTSGRVHLREWRDDDAPFVLDMCSRWEVQRWVGAAPRVLSGLDDARATIARWRGHDDGLRGVWSIRRRDDGAPLGTLLLIGILASGSELPLQPSGETEIGWYLHPDAWGHGYATEAARLVLDHGFAGGLDTIIAVTYPENVASQSVCTRLGMRHEGLTDRYYNMTCELFTAAA
ncbi:GNAT family N-acetyltransferase [Dactylosporangium matsuzakiense]|uniref:N-acetyltransferase n=1 Tax=Dactylosporangium matsuzakiense TaxID=53360 RepID=A0A9W6NLT8_9ACTN|nr:N-acetyltransferase [Dactylosporangium matsuzakiense]